MKAAIAGEGHFRKGVVQAGTLAFLLGASLVAGSAGAAENVERADPAVPAAPPRKKAVAAPGAPAVPATRREDLDARLRDAQERLERASQEIAAIAAERAAEVAERFTWRDAPRRAVVGIRLDANSKGGAKVEDVSPGGPAEQAGVRPGDVIVAVNGKEVKGDNAAAEVARLLRDVEPESTVKLRVQRDGRTQDIDVVARPFAFARIEPPPGEFNGQFGPWAFNFSVRRELAGLEVTTLTPALGKYFGTDKGVLVVRAPEDGHFKLQDGDVILSVDGREPTSGTHLSRILSSYQPGEKVTLRVMRDRKQQDITITLPEGRPRQVRSRVVRPDIEHL